MRDGVHLYGALYLPPTGDRFPSVLTRTNYSTQRADYVALATRFAQAGYSVLLVDSRGRYESEGVWHPYFCEVEDGYDTQQWMGAQPWCDGNIGMFGRSYVGFTQLMPAPLRSPYIKGLVPCANQQDNYGHMRLDGVLQLQNVMNFIWLGNRTNQTIVTDGTIDMHQLYRRLPLLTALDDVAERPFYKDIIQHPNLDDFWMKYSLRDKYDQVDAPAYFITGWYDNLIHEGFKCYQGWRAHGQGEAATKTRILVGPWPHAPMGTSQVFGDIDFGPAATLDLGGEHLRWYEQRLKGIDNGFDDEPPVRIFVMGINEWRSENEWPLARTQYTSFYLHSNGKANSFHGDGTLDMSEPQSEQPTDAFDYDPLDPVPTVGGQSMFLENNGPRDRRSVERRDDVLVYTTEPLGEDTEVTGPIELVLYAASSAPDTDFTATLVDVYPNGKAINISEGIVRARFRESHTDPTLIEPGKVYRYTIKIWETSNVFRAGHHIRLEISSSNFPRFDRNLNTGEDCGLGTRTEIAQQTVYHQAGQASHLVLPIIPK